MSYTYEKVSSNKAKLSFVVAAEDFEAAVQRAYLKNRNKINMPGFRKGKAPRKMIETMYGESVFYDDALEDIFPGLYEEAVTAEKLQVVDRPSIDVQEVGAGKDLKFTAEVFVRPDVKLGDYKGLTVEIKHDTVTDEAVQARIDQDVEKASRVIDVEDRPVENGDTVKLDYAGTVDGVAFEGGTAQDQTLVIGSNQFIPGFEEQMIGMNLNEEKDLNVTFPAEYHAKELAGKAAVFHVKVNGIQKTEKPEMDDDFAADVSDYNTFAEYKAAIEKEVADRVEKNNEVMAENALVEKAVANAEVDIPEAMIRDEQDYMVREMAMRMSQQGLRFEDYLKYTGMTMDKVREMYKGEAENRVKTQLVLEAIRDAEGIVPTDEEVDAQIAEQAERMGQEKEAFEKTLNDEQRGYLKDSAAIQKVVDLLKKDAVINEKKEEEPAEEKKDAE